MRLQIASRALCGSDVGSAGWRRRVHRHSALGPPPHRQQARAAALPSKQSCHDASSSMWAGTGPRHVLLLRVQPPTLPPREPLALLGLADKALYHAKHHGRDRKVLFWSWTWNRRPRDSAR
ncbi:hypothetical protein DSL92_00500 [Billgrantia gudaonensis]|uniref:GGDEF domain-containing protein n=1 Tax=Billgrantia gudaonensis TaxID=376427 RepID=A0A3S0R5L5_9GAMM|nr:hypothetical protein DSL92_00500 [Halomonas gudaonensis]